jgi:Cytochrome C oxidase, cbb3-type, subunit III
VGHSDTFLDTLSPRPRERVLAGGAHIGAYRDGKAAAHVFSRAQNTFPMLQHGNVIVLFSITPQPTAGEVKQLEACAFGADAHPAIGRLVLFGGRKRSGRQVVLDSGCLACHRIGSEGNGGPGPNLSAVGATLTPQAIATVLRHPRPPMPPSRLSRSDFRALVAYLSQLR